ncbi:hypothetical protein ABZX65_01575 [Streptomyces sp. NPDC003300]|uniref:hypothetical protein n=1 Tax=unclassified Streptomyces TaxID=2593676 RepID=UPI0033AE582F
MPETLRRTGRTPVAWEWAHLDGGPADGMRVRVTGPPRVLQVTSGCQAEDEADGDGRGLRVEALYVYRLKHGQPLHYGWDHASP